VSKNDWVLTKYLKIIIMLKIILKLEGAQKLTKIEQKSIKGGSVPVCPVGEKAKRCTEGGTVPGYWECVDANFNGYC
jgi:hypothetical protein